MRDFCHPYKKKRAEKQPEKKLIECYRAKCRAVARQKAE